MGQWLLFIGLSGIFISGLAYVYHRGYEKANRFLAYFLFLGFLYMLIQYNTGYGDFPGLSAVLMSGFPSLYYLIGPCAFFYIRSIITDDDKLTRRDLLHLIPFVFVCSGTIPFIFTSWEEKLAVVQRFQSDQWAWMDIRINAWMPDPVNQIARAFHSLAYFGYTLFQLFVFFRNPVKNRAREQVKIMRFWLVAIIGIAFIMNVSYLFVLAELLKHDRQHTFLMKGAPSLLVIVLGAIAAEAVIISFPQILYGIPENPSRLQSAKDSVENPALTVPDEPSRAIVPKWHAGQLLTEEYCQDIGARLQNYVALEEVLKVECSIAHLSDKTSIPQHHLHYYFSQIIGEKFHDWKNRHRVKWVTEWLAGSPDHPYTLDAIASKAGFEHRSTFVAAFKKFTGMLPKEFMKSLKNQG